jgi:hypothetical protein
MMIIELSARAREIKKNDKWIFEAPFKKLEEYCTENCDCWPA